MKKLVLIFLSIFFVAVSNIYSNDKPLIVVAADGSGDYKTITEAINALPMFNYERTVIYVKNGVYKEKIRIEQDNVTLRGESKDKTIIEYNQLRTDWIDHPDNIGPAVINIHADDIILENLTIENTQPKVGPHAFAIYGRGTRTVIVNCNVLSNGGDTISLWDYKTGMYYHADCFFRGAVDFVCPRGWCFIKDSKFDEVNKAASIWHAGGYNENQKFVLKNCSFNGVEGYYLGRHHYEAQFYLLGCEFSKSMADKPIFFVFNKNPNDNRPFNWGERDYFYNCHKDGGDLDWFKDNLSTAKGSPKPEDITPSWTFDGKWDPESTVGPDIIKYNIEGDSVLFYFDEHLTIIGSPELKSSTGKLLKYESGGGSNTLKFVSTSSLSKDDLKNLSLISGGKVLGTIASVKDRAASFKIN